MKSIKEAKEYFNWLKLHNDEIIDAFLNEPYKGSDLDRMNTAIKKVKNKNLSPELMKKYSNKSFELQVNRSYINGNPEIDLSYTEDEPTESSKEISIEMDIDPNSTEKPVNKFF